MNQVRQHEAAHHCRVILNHDSSATPGNLPVRAALVTLLVMAVPLLAQQTPPSVMAGTRLRVKFDSTVGTAISRQGDGVAVQLIKPVEADGREALPIGTLLTGRVLFVRKGDTHKKVVPVLRLAFEQARLPDGRTFPAKASLAGLGILVHVDSEGAATPTPNTKTGDVGAAATTAGAGAGIGAIAGGGSGAAEGAAIGAGVGVLGDLLTRNSDYWDFTLNKGRKAWLRLDADLATTVPATSEPSLPQNPAPGTPLATPGPATLTTPAPANKEAVYVEPVPNARLYRVNEDALRRDISKEGITIVEESSGAGLLLSVWDDSHGFHGNLTDRKRVMVWAGSAATQGGLVRGLVRYMHGHGLL